MIWLLLRVAIFLVAVAAATWGLGILIDQGEGIRITAGGIEVTLGPVQAVVGALALLAALWLVLQATGLAVALIRFLNGDETALSRHLFRNRVRKGHEALAQGLLAIAAGEGKAALAQATRAGRLLDRPELTDPLTAQAAELAGDRARAAEVFERLRANERTRFVGLRGILRQKLADGDSAAALALAREALALRPKHEEVQDILLRLQAGAGDWGGARATLVAKSRAGALPKDVWRRRDAVLALQEARDVFAEGRSIEARETAIAANRQSPDLIPAAAMAARAYIAANRPRHAARVLRKAWEMRPHPDLAAAFAEIEPDETPSARVRRFAQLTAARPDDPESRLLAAELLIAAEDFPAARRALGDLVESHPTVRALTVMAAIERGMGADDAVVRGWLARALTAPRGPQWVCDRCHSIHSAWAPVCGNCGAFDTLAWTAPVETQGHSPTRTEMLPLIVGTPAKAPAAPPPADAPESDPRPPRPD
ncbi:MAG: heme biosynthesis protein HemY [Rhodobacteraceae bacterium]|nr:heme biosynthesis protein HemY [Paracoccaceae bacterium]